jgi:hypothetical protein
MKLILDEVNLMNESTKIEIDYAKLMTIYSKINRKMNIFESMKLEVLDIYHRWQQISNESQMSEIDLLMKNVNL